MVTATLTLWRPTGPQELELVKASGWRAWPPRLPDQPIFYPVLNEEYAIMIARDWNVPASGARSDAVRAGDGYRRMSMIAKLPAWLKSAKHRDEILKSIVNLKRSIISAQRA